MMELVVTVTVLGIVAAVSAPLITDTLSVLWFAGGKGSEHLVIREVYDRISGELREAVETPDSLRPRVSADRSSLRFYLNGNPADSVRYFFGESAGRVYLKRTAGGSTPEFVPEYLPEEVSSLSGSFEADGGGAGRSSTGRIGVELIIETGDGFEVDSKVYSFEIYCRNFR